MSNHIPRRSGRGMRQVLAPVVRQRSPFSGAPAGKVRMRPAPNPFMFALKARRAAAARAAFEAAQMAKLEEL